MKDFVDQHADDMHKNGSNTKPTNPKDALAINKAPLSVLPTGPMYAVALAMLEGARKYGRHNYRVIGVSASVYYDAIIGHITSWWEGEDIDSASDLHHLDKAMASLAVLRDGMMMENWIDDRPPKYPHAEKLLRNNPGVKDILKKYPDCVEPYTELNKDEKRFEMEQKDKAYYDGITKMIDEKPDRNISRGATWKHI